MNGKGKIEKLFRKLLTFMKSQKQKVVHVQLLFFVFGKQQS